MCATRNTEPMVPDFPLRIHAVCFDAFGTLIDIATVNDFLEQRFPTLGEQIGSVWRMKQIDYTRLRSIGDRYKPFGEVTQDALTATLRSFDISQETDLVTEVMNQYRTCNAFDDSQLVLQTLSTPWSILTNGDRDFIDPILSQAGIAIDKDQLITSDQVHDFKVSPTLYQQALNWACSRGVNSRDNVLFVTANQWDAIGATWFGFTTCWINRNGETPEELDATPTREVSELTQVIEIVNELTC